MTARKGRRINGIVLLDKPLGCTSNAALQDVKRLFQARKAGHTGSLDPLATGMLPLCLGEATKLSAFLLDADKRYQFVCRLGITTATADAEGEITQQRPVGQYDDAQIAAVLASFTGLIEQLPPMYSALKHKGKRLYELARQGIEVERQPRQVTIHKLDLQGRGEDWIECEAWCSKGTYIRTLAEDIGAALGCGAHVSQLRRTAVTPYAEQQMLTMEALNALAEQGFAALDSCLLKLDSAVMAWPALQLDAASADYLQSGQAVLVPHAPAQGWIRLYQTPDRFFGMGEMLDDGRIALRRLIKGD